MKKKQETLVRAAFLIALISICGSAAAQAQAWDSRYPVCGIVYGPTSYNDCRYFTIPQCQAQASGLPIQCVENPYFAGANSDSNRHRRRRFD